MLKNQKMLNTISRIALFFICINAFSQEEKKIELEEIKVEYNKKAITVKNGTLKVDVANSIYSTIANPLDLLVKLPDIQVSPDKENITLIGKGSPLLYIDNQKVDINILNSLTVDDIKTIEIIRHPSSKYEANGRAVIHITRKLSKREGMQIDISEKASFQRNFNNYFGLNSSFKKKKLEFKTSFNYNQLTVWEKNGNNFTIPANDIISNYMTKAITKRPQFIIGTGLFYKINDDDYLSFNYNQRLQNDRFNITTTTYNQQESLIENIYTLNSNHQKRNFLNTSLNYNHKLKKSGVLLFSGFQYSHFEQPTNGIISNDVNDSGLEVTQNRDQNFLVDVFSGKLDIEKEFKNKMKLEFGAQFSKADSDTQLEIENFNSENDSKTDYNYRETNAASYVQISGDLLEKIDYTIGLRGEKTVTKGKQSSDSFLSIDKNYFNWFPKVAVNYAVNDVNAIFFNYAKSINRPVFSMTSQISTYINPYFIWTNNINLNPTITDEISISYEFKNKVLELSYYKSKSPIYYATIYNESENLLLFQSENFDKESGFNLGITLPFAYKKWSTTNKITGVLNKIENEQSVLNQTKPYLYYYSNHLFKFKKGIQMIITGWGLTDRMEGVYKRNALFTMDFGISKTFFNQLDCALNYNDIFRQMKFREDFTTNNISSKGIYYTDANLLVLSIKYSFGKIKNSEFKEKSINDNLNRIK